MVEGFNSIWTWIANYRGDWVCSICIKNQMYLFVLFKSELLTSTVRIIWHLCSADDIHILNLSVYVDKIIMQINLFVYLQSGLHELLSLIFYSTIDKTMIVYLCPLTNAPVIKLRNFYSIFILYYFLMWQADEFYSRKLITTHCTISLCGITCIKYFDWVFLGTPIWICIVKVLLTGPTFV